MRTGLIAHDAARAQPGYTLFAPMYGDGTVYLVDMHGKVVHTWRLPYRPGLTTATCSPTGICCTAARLWTISSASRGGAASRAAQCSKWIGLRNGNVLLLGTEENGTMYADYVVEMTTGGADASSR